MLFEVSPLPRVLSLSHPHPRALPWAGASQLPQGQASVPPNRPGHFCTTGSVMALESLQSFMVSLYHFISFYISLYHLSPVKGYANHSIASWRHNVLPGNASQSCVSTKKTIPIPPCDVPHLQEIPSGAEAVPSSPALKLHLQ